MLKVYFAELRKASKIDFSSSGREFSLIALASAERQDSMLYFGWNCFSSDLRRPSWMRKKFLMLLIYWYLRYWRKIEENWKKSYPIFVLSILKSFFEQLLGNYFSLGWLCADRRQFKNRENQVRQVIIFRCTQQNVFKRLQFVFIFDLIEILQCWDVVVVKGRDGIFIRHAGVEENAVVKGSLEVALAEVFWSTCDDAVIFFVRFFSFLFFLTLLVVI